MNLIETYKKLTSIREDVEEHMNRTNDDEVRSILKSRYNQLTKQMMDIDSQLDD